MEIIWTTREGVNGNIGKQHAYTPKISSGGNKRNVSLCGRLCIIGEDEKSEMFDAIEHEPLDRSKACKKCLKIYDVMCD